MPMTEKQRRFVEAFMGPANGNQTEAARLAGYQGNAATLRSIASENLTKPDIVREIARIREERDQQPQKRQQIADRAQREQFFSDVLRGLVPDVVVTKDGRTVEVPASLTVRAEAGRTLGKMQGDFIKRVEQTERPAYDLSRLTKDERALWLTLIDKVARPTFADEDQGRGGRPPRNT